MRNACLHKVTIMFQKAEPLLYVQCWLRDIWQEFILHYNGTKNGNTGRAWISLKQQPQTRLHKFIIDSERWQIHLVDSVRKKHLCYFMGCRLLGILCIFLFAAYFQQFLLCTWSQEHNLHMRQYYCARPVTGSCKIWHHTNLCICKAWNLLVKNPACDN